MQFPLKVTSLSLEPNEALRVQLKLFTCDAAMRKQHFSDSPRSLCAMRIKLCYLSHTTQFSLDKPVSVMV